MLVLVLALVLVPVLALALEPVLALALMPVLLLLLPSPSRLAARFGPSRGASKVT